MSNKNIKPEDLNRRIGIGNPNALPMITLLFLFLIIPLVNAYSDQPITVMGKCESCQKAAELEQEDAVQEQTQPVASPTVHKSPASNLLGTTALTAEEFKILTDPVATNSSTPGSYGGVEDIYNRYASMDEYLASSEFQPELANALEYRYRTRGKGPEPAGGWRTAFSDNTYAPGFSVGPNADIPWGQPGTSTGASVGTGTSSGAAGNINPRIAAGQVKNTNFYTPNAQDPLNKIYNKYVSFDDYRRSPDFNPQEATGLEYRYQTTGKGAAPEGGWKSRFVADVGILTPQGEYNTDYQNQWSGL